MRWSVPVAGVLALMTGLVIYAPAATLYGWFAPEGSPIVVRSISGTALAGRANAVAQQQRVYAEQIEWTLRPLSLLLGQARIDLTGRALGAPFTGTVSAWPNGSTAIRSLQSAGDLKALLTSINQHFLPLAGQWRLELDRLEVKNEWPTAVAGELMLHQLSWTLSRDPMVIGDFAAQLSTEPAPDGGGATVVATLRSLDGAALQVEGSARQFADRRQSADLRLRPAPGAPPMIVNMLNGIGAPDAEGWYRLQRQGRLP